MTGISYPAQSNKETQPVGSRLEPYRQRIERTDGNFPMNGAFLWWQHGSIYHIYPRSFQDSNGDGVGDLPGILERLDYCASLGVDALWLSPIFPSPMADFGYDVADYTNVDPSFGTLAQFDALVAGLKRRGLRLILDFVPNHSSDQHPWFRESRASRASTRRDWYIWRDPAPDGGPPNNWMSNFGGSAWQLDERTGQYYYHAFLKEQPDLNWRNPEVRAAMHDVLRFWLDRGVDGFRIDVVQGLTKDPAFPDDPPGQVLPHAAVNDCDDTHPILRELRALADGYEGDRLLV